MIQCNLRPNLTAFYIRKEQRMKLLITGFEPFGGESINPAYEAVKALPEHRLSKQKSQPLFPVLFRQLPGK